MDHPPPVTSIQTLPSELLEWLGEKKIKPGNGEAWVSNPASKGGSYKAKLPFGSVFSDLHE